MSGRRHHPFREMGLRPIFLSIGADTANVNLFTLAGSPGGVVVCTLTIQSGIFVYANSTAFTVSGFAAGSIITILNYGFIVGYPGKGGNGGDLPGHPDGYPGVAGGDAMALGNDVRIDNTYGYIFGGPGGAAGGGACVLFTDGMSGGAGGGGRGIPSPGIAAGGTVSTYTPYLGTNGFVGTKTNPGGGGLGGYDGSARAGSGGTGGDWGLAGGDGYDSAGGSVLIGVGGVGGAPGKAIALNGKTITWLGGNNGTHIVGVVA